MEEQLTLDGTFVPYESTTKSCQDYYAVKSGLKPGIYSTWEECKENVIKVKGSVYRRFDTLEEAQEFMKDTSPNKFVMDNRTLIAFTDGSFEDGIDRYGFGCVFVDHNKNIYKFNGFGNNEQSLSSRNIAGELQAVMFAIKKCYELGYERLCIYHDYIGVSKWALREWGCNKFVSIEYRNFFDEYSEKIQIKFTHIKGHSGNKYNELADKLANKGRMGEIIRDEIPICEGK